MHFLRRLLLAALMLLVAVPASAGEALRRSPGSWFYGPTTLYTVIGAGPASVLTFFPVSEPIPMRGLVNVRVSYQLTQTSGDCKLRPAVQFSSDGSNWEAAKELNTTYVANETIAYGTTFVNLTTLESTPPRTWVRFGLQTLNVSGTANAFCQGSLRVEPEQL